MAWKRRVSSAESKATVALDAVKGLRTAPEIAEKHKLHATRTTRTSYGFRAQEAYGTPLYHNRGALPVREFTHEVL
jgi:hypothetical protein